MMIQIDDTVISTDLFDQCFCCDLFTCKGICCVEGDSGAPLEDSEIEKLESLVPVVWDDLSEKSKELIQKQGVYYVDEDGDKVTSIVDGAECVFTYFDEEGICKCALEKAYREGRSDFYKPISCHLYPVRLDNLSNGNVAVNVHHWKICQCAVDFGKKKQVSVYQFLKEPLIRRFGVEWYEQLCIAAEEVKQIREREK